MAPSAAGKLDSSELASCESLGEATFPLGFQSSGKQAVDSAMRVLRLMHVRELRQLQDRVNEMIVTMQEFTANPKTNTQLGRVGR